MPPVSNPGEAPAGFDDLGQRLREAALRLLAAGGVGLAVWAAASAGHGRTGAAAAHGACFSALRLLRHAVVAFEAQHHALPGLAPHAAVTMEQAALLERQLTEPRDAAGMPSASGPFGGLLDAIPVNPYTGSSALVVVPAGADAATFASTSACGWAYLAGPGCDSAGPLPAGLLLPCGDNGGRPPGRALGSVQEIAFEIEDFERWR